MNKTQLQVCLIALIAVCWKYESASAEEKNGNHQLEKSENFIVLPSISENVRVKRQEGEEGSTPKPKKRRPYNIFKLISVLATETRDETKKAFSDIGALFNSQFSNGTTTTTTTAAATDVTRDNSTATVGSEVGENEITTTTEPFRISRDEFLGILRNNFQGIARLLRKEVKIALADSSKNVKEFGRDLGLAFRPLIFGKN